MTNVCLIHFYQAIISVADLLALWRRNSVNHRVAQTTEVTKVVSRVCSRLYLAFICLIKCWITVSELDFFLCKYIFDMGKLPQTSRLSVLNIPAQKETCVFKWEKKCLQAYFVR